MLLSWPCAWHRAEAPVPLHSILITGSAAGSHSGCPFTGHLMRPAAPRPPGSLQDCGHRQAGSGSGHWVVFGGAGPGDLCDQLRPPGHTFEGRVTSD